MQVELKIERGREIILISGAQQEFMPLDAVPAPSNSL
jgi:hypothetical protein